MQNSLINVNRCVYSRLKTLVNVKKLPYCLQFHVGEVRLHLREIKNERSGLLLYGQSVLANE